MSSFIHYLIIGLLLSIGFMATYSPDDALNIVRALRKDSACTSIDEFPENNKGE
jgi:hypothetical protein